MYDGYRVYEGCPVVGVGLGLTVTGAGVCLCGVCLCGLVGDLVLLGNVVGSLVGDLVLVGGGFTGGCAGPQVGFAQVGQHATGGGTHGQQEHTVGFKLQPIGTYPKDTEHGAC
jgi:hypothetical protein